MVVFVVRWDRRVLCEVVSCEEVAVGAVVVGWVDIFCSIGVVRTVVR